MNWVYCNPTPWADRYTEWRKLADGWYPDCGYHLRDFAPEEAICKTCWDFHVCPECLGMWPDMCAADCVDGQCRCQHHWKIEIHRYGATEGDLEYVEITEGEPEPYVYLWDDHMHEKSAVFIASALNKREREEYGENSGIVYVAKRMEGDE